MNGLLYILQELDYFLPKDFLKQRMNLSFRIATSSICLPLPYVIARQKKIVNSNVFDIPFETKLLCLFCRCKRPLSSIGNMNGAVCWDDPCPRVWPASPCSWLDHNIEAERRIIRICEKGFERIPRGIWIPRRLSKTVQGWKHGELRPFVRQFSKVLKLSCIKVLVLSI